jgi:hypothetical protein
MTGDETSFISADTTSLDSPSVQQLLRVGLSEPRRPIDSLTERLDQADGAAWLGSALERSPIGKIGDPKAVIIYGDASVDDLMMIKENSKRGYAEAQDEDQRHRVLLAYFLAVAAALVHHERLITSQPRESVNEMLTDLGGSLPGQWAAITEQAALKPPV